MNEFGQVDELSRRITEDPTDPWLYDERGLQLLRLSRYEEALRDFDRAIDLDPEVADFHLDRGRLLLELDRSAEARVSFERAVTINPSLDEGFAARAAAAFQEKDYQEALTDIETAIAIASDVANYHHFMARVLANMGRSTDALRAISEAIRLQPNNAGALAFRFNLYVTDLVCENPSAAMEDASRAIELGGAGLWVLFGRGLLYFSMRQWDEATEDFARSHACKTITSAHERSLAFLCITKRFQGIPASEIPEAVDYMRLWREVSTEDVRLLWPGQVIPLFFGEVESRDVEYFLINDAEDDDEVLKSDLFEFHLLQALWKLGTGDRSFETDVSQCSDLEGHAFLGIYKLIFINYFDLTVEPNGGDSDAKSEKKAAVDPD